MLEREVILVERQAPAWLGLIDWPVPPPEWWDLVAWGDLKAPFPWFGGKRRVASLVWDRFGNVVNYVEPFAGSLAVLLGRPHAPVIETVNDVDAHLCNFWRSIKRAPDLVAEAADWPVNELDLHARHRYLRKLRGKLAARLLADPTYCAPMIAGWWVWGLCAWIGDGWCSGRESRQIPDVGSRGENRAEGRGVHARSMRMPMLGAGSGGQDDHPCAHHGRGVHGAGMRAGQLPRLSGGDGGPQAKAGDGINSKALRSRLPEIFAALETRLRYTRVTCGDFRRILSPSVTWRHGITGVFLDPPYPADAGSRGGLYTTTREEREVFDRAFRYCVEHGHRPDLRIALCYYEGTKAAPSIDERGGTVWRENVSETLRGLGWDIVAWKAAGGYGGQSGKNENAHRERIAFSPACLPRAQASFGF